MIENKTNVGGILTPIVDNRRMFYDIASKKYFEMEAVEDEKSVPIGKYLFSEKAFVKAQQIVLKETKNKNIDYVIIDEIGPLEVKKEQGFFEILKKIVSYHFDFTLILVVREQLLEEFISKFNIQKPIILSVEECIQNSENFLI